MSRSHWFHVPFVVAALLLCAYWYFRPPIPNKAVLAIGVVAVIMTLTEMRPSHKAAWLLIVFTLAFLENRAINKERADSESERARVRKEENDKFQAIADGLKGTITQTQTDFNATMKQFDRTSRHLQTLNHLSNENLAMISGGDSYPLFSGTPNAQHTEFEFVVINLGKKYPLYDGSAIITYEPFPTASAQEAMAQSMQFGLRQITLPTLIPNNPTKTGVKAPLGRYMIFSMTRNGNYLELLNVVKCNDGKTGESAALVQKGNKILYQQEVSKTCIAP